VLSSLTAVVLSLSVLIPHGGHSSWLGLPFLYIGPDQVLPLTSFVGAAIGVLLMFWNRVVGVFRRVLKFSSRK
jgi:hypothetical protein